MRGIQDRTRAYILQLRRAGGERGAGRGERGEGRQGSWGRPAPEAAHPSGEGRRRPLGVYGGGAQPSTQGGLLRELLPYPAAATVPHGRGSGTPAPSADWQPPHGGDTKGLRRPGARGQEAQVGRVLLRDPGGRGRRGAHRKARPPRGQPSRGSLGGGGGQDMPACVPQLAGTAGQRLPQAPGASGLQGQETKPQREACPSTRRPARPGLPLPPSGRFHGRAARPFHKGCVWAPATQPQAAAAVPAQRPGPLRPPASSESVRGLLTSWRHGATEAASQAPDKPHALAPAPTAVGSGSGGPPPGRRLTAFRAGPGAGND